MFCLLVAPPLWFVSRHAQPIPDFVAELEGARQKLRRASSQQETVATEDLLSIESAPSPARPEPERVSSELVQGGAPTPLIPQDELQDQPSDDRKIMAGIPETSETAALPSWEPPVLPAEVFRDVPPEECLQSPLWTKSVNPSDYEFGCDEILVSLYSTVFPVFCCTLRCCCCNMGGGVAL